MSGQATLRRTLSLPMMVLYGLGTTIGAGIYALVGELAGVAGYMAPASFLMASIIAGLTAMSFAEMSGRFPRAAGVALYVQEGFSSINIARASGLIVILAGMVSSAALVNGFVGYLNEILSLDRVLVIILITLILGMIAAWGIFESVAIAGIITLIEVGGLLLVIFVSRGGLAQFPEKWMLFIPSADFSGLGSIYAGAILAFYAFIGFEDMVDVAEEVKNVKRTLPIAILLTLGITIIIYILVMTAALLALPLNILAESQAPLSLMYEYYTNTDPLIINIIGMFAIINGALIQIIMASRVIYGLSTRNQLPVFLSNINSRTQTPIIATIIVTICVLILSLIGRLGSLAEATSIIMLTVFSIVNLALWKIKKRDADPEGVIVFPLWVPKIAFFMSSGFVLLKLSSLISV